MKLLNIVLPARLGSNRVKLKNLRHLNGKPLIEYIIETTISTKLVDKEDLFINSDSEIFKKTADKYGISFYKRPDHLATSESLIDEYINDFITNNRSKYLMIINPTSPFLKGESIEAAWKQFLNEKCSTLLCGEKIKTHCFLDGSSINFSTNQKHPRSQDVKAITALNFAISIWNTDSYSKSYQKNGYGVYTSDISFFHLDGFECIDIDYEEDFQIAEVVAKLDDKKLQATYDEDVERFLKENENIQN